MGRSLSPARIAYLRYRKEKAEARLVNCEVRDLTRRDWMNILRQFNYECAYCLKKLRRLTKDHVVPLHLGGNHTASNIVPACRGCNSSKGKFTLEEWFGQTRTREAFDEPESEESLAGGSA